MQRKKPDKWEGSGACHQVPPLPFHRSKPAFEQPPHDSSLAHSTASIIQMLPSDSISSLQLRIFEQAETVFEPSELREREWAGGVTGEGGSGLQNNYNYALAKPKKKYPNRVSLAYNFSNIAILHNALAAPLRKATRCALESVRTVADAGRRGREKNRGSFCSGYTTSSTNGDERMFRKQNKQQLQAKRQEKLQEAAHMINGWVEYKERMSASCVFRELLAYARNRPLGRYLLESTIRNDAPLDNFYLTDYKQEESISLARLMQMQGNVDESLVYTADQNFQFTQREAEITPEKFKKSEGDSEGRKTPSNRESYVQAYRPMLKMHPPLAKQRKDKQEVNYRSMALKKPIPFNSFQQRRYLLVRTNIYEMPLPSPHFADQLPRVKEQTAPLNHFAGGEGDGSADMHDITKELDTTVTLFKSTKLPRKQESLKNIDSSHSYYDQIRDSTASYFTGTIDKTTLNSDYGRSSTEKLIRGQSTVPDRVNAEVEIKRVQSTNNGATSITSINGANGGQDKKATPKIDNYYFAGKQSPTPKLMEKVTSATPDSHSNKLVESNKKVHSSNSIIEMLHKDHGEPKFRFEESLVNGFSIQEESEYKPESKIAQNVVAPVRQDQRVERFNSGLELTLSPTDKNKRSIPKINLMVGSPRQNVPVVAVQSHKRIDSSKNINKDVYSPAAIYDYPAPLSSRPSLENIHKPKLQSPISKDKHLLSLNSHNPILHNSPNYHPSQLTPNPIHPAHNLYQLNYAVPQPHPASRIQTKMEPVLRKPSRVDSPSRYGVVGVQQPTQPLMLRSEEKKTLYFSPDTQREIYGHKQQPLKLNDPQRRPIYHTRKVTTQQPQPQPQPQPSQEYFMREQPHQTHQKTVNLTNNYYITGPPQSTIRQPQAEPTRNVFDQQSKRRKIFNSERPSSIARQSSERGNLFSNYSPHDSEVESQQRSNNFSRNSSELSRPRSMNEKIHLTLKMQHK